MSGGGSQCRRLATSETKVRNSSTGTVAPYAESIGEQSEIAYTKPALIRPTNASQSACSIVAPAATVEIPFEDSCIHIVMEITTKI